MAVCGATSTSHAKAADNVLATFCVSPDGDDANPGTKMQPFASIPRAQQAVRTVNKNMTGDIHVVLRGGVYAINRTLVF